MERCEIFRPVVGFEGLYEISSCGRIRALGHGRSANSQRRYLLHHKQRDGYLAIILYRDGRRYWFAIHRLVGIAFIANPRKLEQINHINGIKDDNRVFNLEWSNSRLNQNHYNKQRALTSHSPGVCKRRQDKKWLAQIRINNKVRHLGYFEKEEDAARAYCEAIVAHAEQK